MPNLNPQLADDFKEIEAGRREWSDYPIAQRHRQALQTAPFFVPLLPPRGDAFAPELDKLNALYARVQDASKPPSRTMAAPMFAMAPLEYYSPDWRPPNATTPQRGILKRLADALGIPDHPEGEVPPEIDSPFSLEAYRRLFRAFKDAPRLSPIVDIPFTTKEAYDNWEKPHQQEGAPPEDSNPLITGARVVNHMINPFAGKPSKEVQSTLEALLPVSGVMIRPSAKDPFFGKEIEKQLTEAMVRRSLPKGAAGSENAAIFAATGGKVPVSGGQPPIETPGIFFMPEGGARMEVPAGTMSTRETQQVGNSGPFAKFYSSPAFRQYPDLAAAKMTVTNERRSGGNPRNIEITPANRQGYCI